MSDKSYEHERQEREILQKKLDAIVKSATDKVASAIRSRSPAISSYFFYGSSAIHPRHLVTWYLFATDNDLNSAKENGLTQDIDKMTREELRALGYPAEGLTEMMVSFTTDEDIQRETGGDHWKYFK